MTEPCVLCGAETVSAPFDALLCEVGAELDRALSLFPSFNSPHEGKAVIEEELDELWECVKTGPGRDATARVEAIQVAAMALRYVLDLCAAASSAGETPE